DYFSGAEGDDSLLGGAGNDTLQGGADADTLVGGVGNDSLDGGVGGDTYLMKAGDGVDTVSEYDSTPGNVDTVRFADLASTRLSALERRDNNLVLRFDSGEQVTISNQFYSEGTGFRIEQFAFSDGVSWDDAAIKARVITYGDANANNIRGYVDGSNRIYGLEGNDALYGAALADTLDGGVGNDTLWGYAGNDVMDGGEGADVMLGGDGNDTYVIDNLADSVTENVSAGVDSIWSWVSIGALGANIEEVRLQGTQALDATGNQLANFLVGNAASNRLTGGDGSDTLDGGSGADILIGGSGNDIFLVESLGDVVTELAGEGVDRIQSAVTILELAASVEELELLGSEAINGAGNELSNIILGNSAGNVLTGGAGADSLFGAAGNDTLSGGIGVDALAGGDGADVYQLDGDGDSVVELAAEGLDTVRSSSSVSALWANVENLTLTGARSIDGVGNELSNRINGSSGNNKLDGRAGNDTLLGGLGIDTYILGRGYGSDRFTDIDSTAGNTDILAFGSDIAAEQLWFRRSGNDLEISVIGTSDRALVTDWYLASANHLEKIRTLDGRTLLDTKVDNLVNAMAAFAPPPPGQLTLPPDYLAALSPVIASNWRG
ncbi:calcium-binding protein, partial [Ideonella sp. 4Y11]